MDTDEEQPPVRLFPESWTEEEAAQYDGRRIRFRDGRGEATVMNVAGFIGEDGYVFQYALQVLCDDGPEIYLAKGDMSKGDWAFDVV